MFRETAATLVKIPCGFCQACGPFERVTQDNRVAMKPSVSSTHAHAAGWLLDLALLAVAATYLLLPDWRTPSGKAAVLLLYFVQAGLGVHGQWRAGQLTTSVRQLHASLGTSGRPGRRPFEAESSLVGFVALCCVFWA